jgi:hypothetical protein
VGNMTEEVARRIFQGASAAGAGEADPMAPGNASAATEPAAVVWMN